MAEEQKPKGQGEETPSNHQTPENEFTSKVVGLNTHNRGHQTKGQDNSYPKTMVKAARLLNGYKVSVCAQRARDDPGEGMAFVQDRGRSRRGGGGTRTGREAAGRDPNNPNCWHCNQPGHHMNRRPDLEVKGIDNLNVDEFDDAHVLFSADGNPTSDGELQDCEVSQECTFSQRGGRG